MNAKEKKEFEKLLGIDRFNLDKESDEQPRLVWAYSRQLAKAYYDRDEAQADLNDVIDDKKTTDAEIDMAIRENPEDFQVSISERTGKPTEMAIKAALPRTKEYQQARKRIRDKIRNLNEQNYRVRLLEGAVRALDHRRTSLSLLNSQDERGYFSRPRGSEDKHDLRRRKRG